MEYTLKPYFLRLTGLLLVCIFAIRLGQTVWRGIPNVKNPAAMEKGTEESAPDHPDTETGDTKDGYEKSKKLALSFKVPLSVTITVVSPAGAQRCYMPWPGLSWPYTRVPTPPPNLI